MFQREIWGHIGVHRPKQPNVEHFDDTHWYNGSGQLMLDRHIEGSWLSALDFIGYDLTQINRYAVESCKSYLVEKTRGRAHYAEDTVPRFAGYADTPFHFPMRMLGGCQTQTQ